jgi:phosphoglycolate phosphatase
VIFDFDFTLADSSPGIERCVNYALDRLRFPVPTTTEILNTVGLSLEETLGQLTGETHPALCSSFSRLFHEHADLVMEANTKIYECVYPVIRRLRAAHVEIGIVSSKLHYRIVGVLRRNGLDKLFSVIVGADDVAKEKPNPEGILLAIQTLGVAPELAVYVGDHTVDAQAARNAGVSFVATLSGMHARENFEPYQCRAILKDLRTLPEILLGRVLCLPHVNRNVNARSPFMASWFSTPKP